MMFDEDHHLDGFTVPDDEPIMYEETDPEDFEMQVDTDSGHDLTTDIAAEEDEPELVPDVQAGNPTNVTLARFEAFMKDFAPLITPKTDSELLSAGWSEFNEHICHWPRKPRFKITAVLRRYRVEEVNNFCYGWLLAQGEESTFTTRAKLRGDMSNYVDRDLRAFIAEWFPAEFEAEQRWADGVEADLMDYLRNGGEALGIGRVVTSRS